MTEAEWLVSEDAVAMLYCWLRRNEVGTIAGEKWRERNGPSDRKLRLWVFAMASAARGADWATQHYGPWRHGQADYDDRDDDLFRVARDWVQFPDEGISPAEQAHLLRDIAGSPFRPVIIGCSNRCKVHEPTWLTPTALAIADAAYDEVRADGTLDNATLSVLADALEDGGCSAVGCIHCGYGDYVNKNPPCSCAHRELLLHLRSSGPHVRGCWALDLILRRDENA